jgi:hypothetical protein
MIGKPQSSHWWRRLVFIGAPLLGLVATLIHPRWDSSTSVYNALAPRIELWTYLHIAQLVIFGLLALVLYYWLEGLPGRAARLGRIALACFVVFYPSFDALVGIGTGVLLQSVQQLDPSQLPVTQKLVDIFWEKATSAPLGGAVGFIGSIGWAGAVLALVVARSSRTGRVPVAVVAIIAWLLIAVILSPLGPDLPPIVYATLLLVFALAMGLVAQPRLLAFLLTIAALGFSFAHVFPAGTIGMTALLAANALAEFVPALSATIV